MKTQSAGLQDIKVHVKLKLSALWASLMFCYIYGDYFGLWQPGVLRDIVSDKSGFMGTQTGLAATSAMMAIPSVMVFLSLVLKPRLNRWVNICLGALYALIMLMTMPGAWIFYILLGIIEIVLTILIVWQAWSWPKQLSDTLPTAPDNS